MSRLKNKIVLITGGSGAIGCAAAKRFINEGAKVMLVDVNEASLQAAVAEIANDAVNYCVADVTSANDTQRFIAACIEQFGGVDVFIANAGIEGCGGAIADYDENDFDKVMAVNVKGIFLGLKYIFPVMEKNGGGSIIISSSVAGIMSSPNFCAYGTSKHAVIGLMKSAAAEGGEKNIRVNTVNPSPVESQMMRRIESTFADGGDTDDLHDEIAADIFLNRYAVPDDVVNMMLFLASDEATFLTGSVYMVDGGNAVS